MPKDERITLTHAAQQIGVSWATAWRLVLLGQLDGRKVGNHWHVTPESVSRVKRERQKVVSGILK